MNRKRLTITGVLLVVALFLGFRWFETPRYFLKTSDEFTFYSILPYDGGEPHSENFHERPVLGKVSITDPAEKAALIDALISSFTNSELRTACFTPHHAIHAVKNGRVFDMVICFECQGILSYKDGRSLPFQPITSDAKKLFNQTLLKHNLPLAKD